MKSKFNKALFALALASLLAACGVQKEGLINSEKTLKVNLFWDYNFTNNYFCGMNNQPATTFMLEGLYHRLDTVDYITPILADGMPVFFDDNLTCRIKIKDAAKWHNGEDFTARDVWAYYMMQHTTVTNYMLSIDVIDDKTLDIHWNPNKQLTNDIKLKLLALDRNGSIKYDEYAEFVDTAAAILLT